jgi:hypothetical protein
LEKYLKWINYHSHSLTSQLDIFSTNQLITFHPTHLTVDNLPPTLTHLTTGYNFNQPVDKLPPKLTHLTVGDHFNQLVDLHRTYRKKRQQRNKKIKKMCVVVKRNIRSLVITKSLRITIRKSITRICPGSEIVEYETQISVGFN